MLKLAPEDQEALREQAAREHRSMHEVAVLAIQQRIGTARRNAVLDALTDEIFDEDAKLLSILEHS